MIKEARQSTLLEIISTARISSQAQLVKALRKKGFPVTQASVSRDLDELGVTKDAGKYRRSIAVPRRAGAYDEFNISCQVKATDRNTPPESISATTAIMTSL